MIGWLSGIVRAKQAPSLLLDVGGVGYELEVPTGTFADLPAIDDSVSLFTHLIVREDAHQLYGFSAEREREVFRALLKVNGVGAKVALAILSGMDGDSFARCVIDADTASLTRIPGIGKKTAERLILEMRDRLQSLVVAAGANPSQASHPARAADPISEAVSALISLGLKPPEASRRIAALDSEGLPPEELVRLALRNMA
ncbi:MAG: Holliday junction DNA helicase RuvA [Gammaproteobacteria bacterium]|jgi:Holliday junction DNA helicase RuvA